MRSITQGNPHCTSVTMDMSIRKQMTQQMAATTSRRRADLGGSMSMIPVIKPSTPTNWKRAYRDSRENKRGKKGVSEWARNRGTQRWGCRVKSETCFWLCEHDSVLCKGILRASNFNVFTRWHCWIHLTEISRWARLRPRPKHPSSVSLCKIVYVYLCRNIFQPWVERTTTVRLLFIYFFFLHHLLETSAYAWLMWLSQEKERGGWRRNEGENGKWV